MIALEKRSSESALYDIDCSLLLAAGETFSSIASVTAEPVSPNTPLVLAGAALNSVPIVYGDHTAPIGTVIQVNISGGEIAAGADVKVYLIRAKGPTSRSALVEATVRLIVTDTPAA